jgi:uncharacterized protein
MDYECRVPDEPTEARDAGQAGAALNLDPRVMSQLESAARQNLARMQRPRNGAAASRYKTSVYDIPVALADGCSLLFNSRTRSLVLLSEAETRIYRGLAASETFPASQISDPLLLQALAGGGHVVGENVDEKAAVRGSYEAARAAPNTLNLTIAPTMACNFACGYCFQGANKPTKKMTPEVQEAILGLIKQKRDLKTLNIVWYGGEPLMGKEAIFRMSDILIAHCDKHRINYTAGIVSNAYFLTAEIAAQLYARRIKWVQITIDGDRETHNQMRPLTSGGGTFDRILDNMAATIDATPISISVRVNVGQRIWKMSADFSISSRRRSSPAVAASTSISLRSRHRRPKAAAPSRRSLRGRISTRPCWRWRIKLAAWAWPAS